jgi:hypothetical protein
MRGPGRHPARAGIAVAALALTCAGCSHILPLGPAPAAPRHLGSAIILQLVLSQPPSPAGGCPAGYTTLSAPFTDYPEVPEASALAAITAKAFDSRDPMAISTAGKTWGVTMTAGPLTNGQFGIGVQSKNQVLQLQRIVLPSA